MCGSFEQFEVARSSKKLGICQTALTLLSFSIAESHIGQHIVCGVNGYKEVHH